MKSSAFIGLGSNLDLPIQQVLTAIQSIKSLLNTSIETVSSFYETPPMGPQNQPPYVNTVVKIQTSLDPLTLLNELQAIETQQGRVRGKERWGARTIDLDILLYDNEVSTDSVLTLPHPEIASRSFVLYPLVEIDEQLHIPGLSSVKQLVIQLGEPEPLKINPELLEK